MPDEIDPETRAVHAVIARIEQRQRAVGLTQRQMLENAGVSQSTLRNMKRGIPPNMRILWKIASALDVPVAYLFTTEETPGNHDPEIIERAIAIVEGELTKRGRVTTRRRKAVAIASICDALTGGKKDEIDLAETLSISK